MNELEGENLTLYNELVKVLHKYGKVIDDLKDTNGFIIKELLSLLECVDQIFAKVDDYQKASGDEKYKKRSTILEMFTDIIKYPRRYMPSMINKQLPQGRRIKGAVCVGKLLNLRPESIYQRIQGEVQAHQDDMNGATLNLFIDYLFDLAFSYIKYDLTRMVSYFDFIFTEEYLSDKPDVKQKIEVIEEVFLKRLRIFCCDNNLLLKILIDLDFPYHDAKEISKLLVEIDQDTLSTSKVMDMMEEKYEEIKQSKKINNVTKDLIKILLKK